HGVLAGCLYRCCRPNPRRFPFGQLQISLLTYRQRTQFFRCFLLRLPGLTCVNASAPSARKNLLENPLKNPQWILRRLFRLRLLPLYDGCGSCAWVFLLLLSVLFVDQQQLLSFVYGAQLVSSLCFLRHQRLRLAELLCFQPDPWRLTRCHLSLEPALFGEEC